MNATLSHERAGLIPPHVVDSMRASHGAQVLREAPIVKHFAGGPMGEAVCTLLGPVVDWFTDKPSNPASTIVGFVLAPVAVLILLPFFLALMPILIIALVAGASSASAAMVPKNSESPLRVTPSSSELPILERKAA